MKIEHMPYIDLLERLEQMPVRDFLNTVIGKYNITFWRGNDHYRIIGLNNIPKFGGDTAEEIIDILISCKILT